MSRYSWILFSWVIMVVPASADSWAEKMFDDLSKDFGSVPRGPELSHPFRVTNNTGKPVRISSTRVSCGCVSVSTSQDELEPGQTATINARMDTRRFLGTKTVTIYVQFSRPSFEEVRIWVRANSRDDIHVNPESFSLGSAKKGSTPSGQVSITVYNGAHILEVERESNYILTELRESKQEGGGVAYQLKATIRRDCPAGKWYSDLWLKTDNASMPRIRVPLNVEIEPSLNVSPASLALGQIKMGSVIEKKIIVRASEPFKITKLEGTNAELSTSPVKPEAKTMHVLTVKLKPAKLGTFNQRIKVATDLKDEGEIGFDVSAEVAQ